MPDNVKQIKHMMDVLPKTEHKPTNVTQPASIDQVPVSLNQSHNASPTKTRSHIRQLVEASIVHDMTHVEGLDSIKENGFAKEMLTMAMVPSTFSCQDLVTKHSRPNCPAVSVCLTGPNGTGKTSLMMAAVKESGRQMIMVQSSTLSNSLVGDSEK